MGKNYLKLPGEQPLQCVWQLPVANPAYSEHRSITPLWQRASVPLRFVTAGCKPASHTESTNVRAALTAGGNYALGEFCTVFCVKLRSRQSMYSFIFTYIYIYIFDIYIYFFIGIYLHISIYIYIYQILPAFPHQPQASCLPRGTVLELWDELLTSPQRGVADLARLSVALLELREAQLLRSHGQQLMWLGEGFPPTGSCPRSLAKLETVGNHGKMWVELDL